MLYRNSVKQVHYILPLLKRITFPQILLLFILLIALFFRFYDTPLRYSLGGDETRDAIVAYEGAKQMQLPLIGPFSSLGPFTFGPWYYYQIILFQLITGLSFAPWIYLGLASLLSVFIFYKIGEELIDCSFGLILATLCALSPHQITSAIGLNNPNLIPLYAALSLLIFLKIVNRNISLWYGFFLGLSIGIGINIHYQMITYALLPLLIPIVQPKKYMHVLTAYVGIFLTFIPMLLFDLNNHWFTVRNMVYFYLHGQDLIYVPNRWLFYLRDFWPTYWSFMLGVPKLLSIVIAFGCVGVLVYSLWKKTLSKRMVLLLLFFLFNFVLLRYYKGERTNGYLYFLDPFLFIIAGYLFYVIIATKHTIIGILIFMVILGFAFTQNYKNISHEHTQDTYNDIQSLVQIYPAKKFSLYHCISDLNDNHMKSLLYVLTTLHKIDDSNGYKIGVLNPKCQYLTNNISSTKVDGKEVIISRYIPIKNVYALDLNTEKHAKLEKSGWKKITTEDVFFSVTKWWYNEKP